MNKISLTPEDKQNIKNAVKSESFALCILHSTYSTELKDFILKKETGGNLEAIEKDFLENTQAFEQVPLAHIIDFVKICQIPCVKGKDQFKVINAQKRLFVTIVYSYIKNLVNRENQNISLTQILTKDKVAKIM